jgi:hypothetical protein
MKNINKKLTTKFGLFLVGISPLLLSWLLVIPAIAQTSPGANINSLDKCFSNKTDVKNTIKESIKTGKPLLTEKSLNERWQKLNSLTSRNDIQKINNDLKGFVNANFCLTPQQKTFFSRLSKEDIAKIKGAIQKAQANKIPLEFRFIQRKDIGSIGIVDVSETREIQKAGSDLEFALIRIKFKKEVDIDTDKKEK